MAIAFRSSTAVTTGTRTTTTVTMPAGAAAGDEIRIVINAGMTGATAPTFTPPGTVTLVATLTWGDPTGNFGSPWSVRHSVYRYRVVGSGDPGSFAFTHASAASDAGAFAWSGVDASTPDDAAATTNPGDSGSNATALGLTTVTADAMLVAVRGSWDGNAITPPGGWTERLDQVITWVGEQTKAAAGATGNISIPNGNGGTWPWCAILMALRPASGAPSNFTQPYRRNPSRGLIMRGKR